MADEIVGNVLVAQSGGPTAVINASLAGVISEALNHDCIEEIYGGLHGIEGILREDLIDLAAESQQVIRGLRFTPGSALGTCRFKMKRETDFARALDVFRAHDIRYFFYIGGNDSQDTASKISSYCRDHSWEIRVMGVPKTIDNDLPLTDHTPGYGSVIKHVATTVRELALDAEGMARHDLVHILEVMGRNTGWIAAGASLAKRREHPEDPPHIILLPERPFDSQRFMDDVADVLKRHPYCMVVVGEGLVDDDGNYLTVAGGGTDSFGHSQLGGAGDFLKNILDQNFTGVKTRSSRLGHTQRVMGIRASLTDNNEAFEAGRAAVERAIDGITDKMITLVRGESDRYVCEYGLADLQEVANGVKHLPPSWINEDGISLSYQFARYALPLIQGEVEVPFDNGLPAYIKLSGRRIEKALAYHGTE